MYFGFYEFIILFFLIIVIVLVIMILSVLFKKMYHHLKNEEPRNKNTNSSTPRIIPETCPHCKNPNTKKTNLCEWCGNQVY
jgi:hypothetical protein